MAVEVGGAYQSAILGWRMCINQSVRQRSESYQVLCYILSDTISSSTSSSAYKQFFIRDPWFSSSTVLYHILLRRSALISQPRSAHIVCPLHTSRYTFRFVSLF